MRIKGNGIALEFDNNGRAVRIENILTGEEYPLCDGGERLVCEHGVYESSSCVRFVAEESRAEFIYEHFTVLWEARTSFFEKSVTFTAPRELTAESVTVLDVTFPESADVHYHDDCTIWHCPLCVYARHERGGVYYGLEYPYWDDERIMTFSPWVTLGEGESFVCEKAFVGAYAFTGKRISSHGPYPGERKQKYFDIFHPERSGLTQHFDGHKIPEVVDIPEEEQDSGEIAAMRAFFREYLGENPLPEEGYFLWQNSWWAQIPHPDRQCIDILENAGIHDVMTSAIYYGHDRHPSCEPAYITNCRVSPLGFPVEKKAAEVTTIADGHHEEMESAQQTELPTEYTDEFSAPEEYLDAIEYGFERGVRVASFSTPNNAYSSRPDWLALNESGEAYKYLGTRVSCPACREYMEHHFNVLCAVFDKYHPRFWGFDGRFIGYREFGGYGNKTIGEDPCFAEGHGHLPGKSRYAEWKNIELFKKKLRERYPRMCLEEYYGLKRGSTWSLTSLNCDENYFECSSADDNRFQNWHNENDRFRPTYMNYAPIFGTTDEEFKYSLISALSTSTYAQVASGYYSLRDSEECVAFLKKWRAWATENYAYLKERVSLFGCPGDVAVDGSAHIIDDEGFIFLFCILDQDETVSLTLDDLPLSEGEYSLTEIYEEEKPLGILSPESNVKVTVGGHRGKIIRVSRV